MADKFQRITELDFERIKTNFRRYLEGQDRFTDYDFSGSGMDIILDLYAYYTHYNAFYLNAAINESFLSSATKRKNVAKAVRPFSYIPRSKTGAQVFVDLEIEIPLDTLISIFGGTDYGIVQLQKNNRFQTKIDGTTYTFVNTSAVSLSQTSDTTFTASNVLLRQGIPNTFRYTVNVQNEEQKFEIPADNVDISTLTVSSQNPALATSTKYTIYKNVPVDETTGNTPIYFLFENEAGRYEVAFGDGKYGYKPVNNEVITLSYLIVNGEPANGARQFTGSNKLFISGNVVNNATVSVSAIGRSAGGTEREGIESIKYYAPKYFLTQGNAIVNSDYESIIRQEFPSIEAANTWGGEENNPPKYGRVIIAAKPFGSLFLTDSEKEVVTQTIRRRMVTTIRPEIIDPKYTYLELDFDIKYDSEKTVKTEQDIQREVVETVLEYADTNFNRFQYEFIHSDLLDDIKSLNSSFISTRMNVKLKKLFQPVLNIAQSYTFYFQNRIYYPHSGHIGSITSSMFTYNGFSNCYLEQTSTGTLSVVTTINNVKSVLVANAATVDYENGVIVLKAFQPESFDGTYLEIVVIPQSVDVEVKREFLLQLRSADLTTSFTDVNSEPAIQSENTTIDTTSNAF